VTDTTPPTDDEPEVDPNAEDAWTDDDARTDDGAVTGGDAAADKDSDDEIGNLADYDAMPDAGPLPDTILPRTPTGGDDDDTINITEHEGPDLNAGDDVDTGAGGTGSR
jgi:hypothetical protein